MLMRTQVGETLERKGSDGSSQLRYLPNELAAARPNGQREDLGIPVLKSRRIAIVCAA
jgi:hypothetical protein